MDLIQRRPSSIVHYQDERSQVRVIVEASTNISDSEITERDIRKIGRSASINDRGIAELFDNAIRRDVIASFHRQFDLSAGGGGGGSSSSGNSGGGGPAGAPPSWLRGGGPSMPGRGLTAPPPGTASRPLLAAEGGAVLPPNPAFVDAAYSIGRWSVSRYRRFVGELRDALVKYNPGQTLLHALDSLQWSIIAFDVYMESEDADASDYPAAPDSFSSPATAAAAAALGSGPALADRASSVAASTGAHDTVKEAERQVWERYCVKVLGMRRGGGGGGGGGVGSAADSGASSSSSPHPAVNGKMREAAVTHFKSIVKSEAAQLDPDALVKTVYLLPYLKIGPTVFDMLASLLAARVPRAVLAADVYPTLAALVAMQIPNTPGARGGHLSALEFTEKLLLAAGDLFTPSAVATFLELCSHTQKADCARAVIDAVGDRITGEAVVTALIPACISGADHYIALMELLVMDRSVSAELENDMDAQDQGSAEGNTGGSGSRNSSSNDDNSGGGGGVGGVEGKVESSSEFMVFVAKSSYLFIFLAAVAGYAKPATIQEVIDFHSDPCAAYITDLVDTHQPTFAAHLFRNVCLLNFPSIAWKLVEVGWMPSSILVELEMATTIGNQGIVHLLLEALLLPDEKLGSSSLPAIFRKSDALSLLPKVARRFPSEAAWFLEQMSCVPLPACIPANQSAEPEVRSKPIQGIRLGSLSLKDTIYKRPKGGAPFRVWRKLDTVGQLKKAGNGKNDYETDSTVCVAPGAMLTATAFHDPLFGKSWSPVTSPFIRLLAEDNEEIILQPVMTALMEYHWARGRFWLRFAFQFAITAAYFSGFATTAVTVVNCHAAAAPKPPYLGVLAAAVLALALFFILQEIREFHDYPQKYLASVLNILDTFIHLVAVYLVVACVFLGVQPTPILLSLALVFAALRIVVHLRVLPSVGPLVRLSMTAAINIMPILIPMGIMAASFAVAFFLLETEAAAVSGVPTTHFENLGESLQSVLSMATTDYRGRANFGFHSPTEKYCLFRFAAGLLLSRPTSVLDAATIPQIFLLRLLFHIFFIIFLVNVIIALMTVNVSDIQSNMNSAWLLEIAGVMVDLELFWPWPIRYSMGAEGRDRPARGWRGKRSRPRARSRSVHPAAATAPPPADEASVVAGTPEHRAVLARLRTVLYTWPREQVRQSVWWRIMAIRAVERVADGDDDDAVYASLPAQSQSQLQAAENYSSGGGDVDDEGRDGQGETDGDDDEEDDDDAGGGGDGSNDWLIGGGGGDDDAQSAQQRRLRLRRRRASAPAAAASPAARLWLRVLAALRLTPRPRPVPGISIMAQQLDAFGEVEKIDPPPPHAQQLQQQLLQPHAYAHLPVEPHGVGGPGIAAAPLRQRTSLAPAAAAGSLFAPSTGHAFALAAPPPAALTTTAAAAVAASLDRRRASLPDTTLVPAAAAQTQQRRRGSNATITCGGAAGAADLAAFPLPPSASARRDHDAAAAEAAAAAAADADDADLDDAGGGDAYYAYPGYPYDAAAALTASQVGELAARLGAVRDGLRALEKSHRSEGRSNRERIRRLEDALVRTGAAAAAAALGGTGSGGGTAAG
ncbi:hypothetical protein DFJ73DRAFT_760608 [Zopfochytrium polystomum]|nr:hypothetical protein DFJ73DRAFT_760608 [Zopfochytrium polystomum]